MDFWENFDLEQNILGAMVIREGERIPEVLRILSAEDFTDEKNRILFSHIVGQYLSVEKLEMVTLIEEMKKAGDFDKVGIEYFTDVLLRTTYTNAYIEKHARELKARSDLTRLKILTQRMLEEVNAGKKSAVEIVEEMSAEFSGFIAADEVSKITMSREYFRKEYQEEIEEGKKYAERETGFKNIDDNQIFSAGLYVLGATPAAGKTTFAWQMAEQLAKNGETCIYCSYEMGKLELFTKTVARELYKREPSTKLTAADIRRGGWTKGLEEVIKERQEDKADLRVLELHNETVDELLKILRPICEGEKKVTVFVDYLQIIPSDKNSTKNGIDDTVRKLKVFQRDTKTTFIVISSLNRASYTLPISFESFKESGNIEYTADVVWGLQLNILNQIKGVANISDTRMKIEEAKKQQPRQIQLKCLKNRQGYNYDCCFRYFSAHDYFEACEESEFEKNPERTRVYE